MTRHLTAMLLCAAALAAEAQTWRIDRQIKQDFPDQQKEMLRTEEVNGLRVYHLRISGGRGESAVQITEGGDYIIKSVPTRLGGMPENVIALLKSLFAQPPTSGLYCERTTYTIDAGGERPVRVEIDAAGRIRDILSGAQLRALETTRYARIDRRDARAVAEKLEQYFDDSRITQIYQYPDAPGFYYAELTADHGTRKAEIVMDTRKDVPYWRYEIRPHELPRPVQRAMNDLLAGAKISRIMRVKSTWYRIEQPVRDDVLTVDIRPTGDVVRVRGELLDGRGDRPAADDRPGRDHRRDDDRIGRPVGRDDERWNDFDDRARPPARQRSNRFD